MANDSKDGNDNNSNSCGRGRGSGRGRGRGNGNGNGVRGGFNGARNCSTQGCNNTLGSGDRSLCGTCRANSLRLQHDAAPTNTSALVPGGYNPQHGTIGYGGGDSGAAVATAAIMSMHSQQVLANDQRDRQERADRSVRGNATSDKRAQGRRSGGRLISETAQRRNDGPSSHKARYSSRAIESSSALVRTAAVTVGGPTTTPITNVALQML